MVLAHEGIMNPDIHPGDVVEIEPHNALLWAVRIGGGDVSYWQQDLADKGRAVLSLEAQLEVEEDDDEAKALELELKTARKELKEAFAQQRAATREMRAAAKMAVDAGIAEREVLMSERMSGILANFAGLLLEQLDIKPRDLEKLPQYVQHAILQLEDPGAKHTKKPKMALTAHKKGDIFVIDEDEADAA
jgi:hypothetical protein